MIRPIFGSVKSQIVPLPVPLPLPTYRMRKRQPKRTMTQRAVVFAAVIFHPGGVRRVLVQVLRADVVMLTFNHLAQAS
jgi:hypothetical protein